MSTETLRAMPFRLMPWLAVAGIAILSLVPGPMRPHTGLPGPAEHFMAYTLTGLVVASRCRSLRAKVLATTLLGLYAGGLEVLQIFVPGRDPEFLDFVVSSAGAILGVSAFSIVASLWQEPPRAA